MSQRIQQLSPLVANQIAAGEVVDRPASVVKELLENSLDAESTRIEITLEKGGRHLICITDNGSGIEKADLALALSRHATSKISQVDDLACITSLGFRGEALASIASVAHLRLISSTGQSAWQVTVEGEQLAPSVIAASHSKGTTIEVKDLFFNTPVRRKFLRTDKTEFDRIDDVVKRIALSHFNVALQFQHNDREVFNLPSALTQQDQQKRVAKICGKKFLAGSLVVQQQVEGLQLTGWISTPENSWAHSDVQYFFLNGRMVRDKLINHALRSAAQGIIPDGRYLAYVLYLQCDPATIDVNVHPTKHEVRFQQTRLIHDFIFSTVVKLLQPENPKTLLPTLSEYCVREEVASYPATQTALLKNSSGALGIALAQLKQHFILSETDQGICLVDLRKARKLLYQQQLDSGATLVSQPLLMPITANLTKQQVDKLLALELTNYGIELQAMGEQEVLLRSLPAILKNVDVDMLLNALATTNNVKQCIIDMAAQIAKLLSQDEMQALLRQLNNLPQNKADLVHCWQMLVLR